jgi:hypothetical protein
MPRAVTLRLEGVAVSAPRRRIAHFINHSVTSGDDIVKGRLAARMACSAAENRAKDATHDDPTSRYRGSPEHVPA